MSMRTKTFYNNFKERHFQSHKRSFNVVGTKTPELILEDGIESFMEEVGSGYPKILFCEAKKGFFSWAIKKITGSPWNHVMEQISPTEVVTQNLSFLGKGGYVIRPLSFYKNEKRIVAFSYSSNTSTSIYSYQRKMFKQIFLDLAQPYYKKKYDYLGISGQLLFHTVGFKKIKFLRNLNNPYTGYCSEVVGKHLRHAMREPLMGIKAPPGALYKRLYHHACFTEEELDLDNL